MSRIPLASLILLLIGWAVFQRWLDLNPGSRVTDYVDDLLPMMLLFVTWCGLWALASKIFRHRFEFWPHVRIAISYLLVTELVELVLPLLSYMLGLTIFSRISWLAGTAVMCAMVVAHFARVLPTRRRLVAITIGALYAAGMALELTSIYQTQDRLFFEAYVATLAPPVLRLASPVPAATFIEEARRLQDALAAHINDNDGENYWDVGIEMDHRQLPPPLPAR